MLESSSFSEWVSCFSVGSFVIKTRFAFLLVKMDLATDSGSEYDKGKKNRVPFFITCVTGNI